MHAERCIRSARNSSRVLLSLQCRTRRLHLQQRFLKLRVAEWLQCSLMPSEHTTHSELVKDAVVPWNNHFIS